MTKGFYIEMPSPTPSPEMFKLQNKILDEAAEAFEKEIPDLQKALTEKLRGLLAPTPEEIPQTAKKLERAVASSTYEGNDRRRTDSSRTTCKGVPSCFTL